jgi:hypothetical protein
MSEKEITEVVNPDKTQWVETEEMQVAIPEVAPEEVPVKKTKPNPITRNYLQDDPRLQLDPNKPNYGVIIFKNGYKYYGPIGEQVEQTNTEIGNQSYIINVLKVSSRFGQIEDKIHDVKIESHEGSQFHDLTPNLISLPTVVEKETISNNNSNNNSNNSDDSDIDSDWDKILYKPDFIPEAQWEWTDYQTDYIFRMPGFVKVDIDKLLSPEMQQELFKRADTDNVIFAMPNLLKIQQILYKDIIIYITAFILVLKYIHDNNVSVIKGSKEIKAACGSIKEGPGITEVIGEDISKGISAGLSISQKITEKTGNPASKVLSEVIDRTKEVKNPYDEAFELYKTGKTNDVMTLLGPNPNSPDLKLLYELCKLENTKDFSGLSELLTKIDTILSSINQPNSSESPDIKQHVYFLILNIIFYIYNNEGLINSNHEIITKLFDDEEKNRISYHNLEKIALENTGLKLLEYHILPDKQNNIKQMIDKTKIEYMSQLTAENEKKYKIEIDDTIKDAKQAEVDLNWTLADILYNRAYRYGVIYFGYSDDTVVKMQTDLKEFAVKKDKAVSGLTAFIEGLQKQLTQPMSVYDLFKSDFKNSVIYEQDPLVKTIVKSILASVSDEHQTTDLFKNLTKNIQIEESNIYDLLLILNKNIIILLNIYLIVCDKIQKNGENEDKEYKIKIDIFMLFNLYYGFKTAYTRLVKLIEKEETKSPGLDIEEDADEIIQNNSKMIEMLLLTLAGSVGAAGVTAVAAMGGNYTKKNKRRYNKVSKNRYKNKNTRQRRKQSRKQSRKLRRKHNRRTRRL